MAAHRRSDGWVVLHEEIRLGPKFVDPGFLGPKLSILIRTMVYQQYFARSLNSWSRRHSPFQRGALPWIGLRLRPPPQTAEKVHQKNHLPGNGYHRGQGDELLQRDHRCHILYAGKFRVAARMSGCT